MMPVVLNATTRRLVPAVALMALSVIGGTTATAAPALPAAPHGRVLHEQPAATDQSLVSSGVGPVISRSQIFARALTWVGNQSVLYSQSRTYPGPGGVAYRGDCSGFVSMSLGLPAPGPNTVALINDVVEITDPAQMRPGDLLGVLGPDTGGDGGHVQVFKQWLNPQHTLVEVLEQGSDGSNNNDWPGDSVYSWPEYPIGARPFKMYRYVNAVTPPAHGSDHVSDTSGDGFGDVLATQSNGTLWDYLNTQGSDANLPSYSGGLQVGHDWPANGDIVSADVDGDGYADLLATRPDGTLWYYANAARSGGGPYNGGVQIGTGWQGFSQIHAADVNGDGRADLVAERSDGTLWYWQNSASGGLPYGGGRQIGTGWQGFRQVIAADVTGDGYADLVGIDGNGDLWLWGNTRAASGGGFPYAGAVRIGNGWQPLTRVVSADVNGDGYADLVATNSTGELWSWMNSILVNPGGLPYLGGTRIGWGWQGLGLVG